MIGRLAGRIEWKGNDHVLIDVRGVGYIVYVSDRTRAALPAPGGFAALYTHLLVREDLLQLFGFLTLQEKEWHRLLTTVQGIGAKASLAVLGTLGPDGVSRAIALGDWAAVKAAPGVGPKLAQRVVNELKDRAADVMAMGTMAEPSPPDFAEAEADTAAPAAAPARPATPAPAAPALAPSAQADALSALGNLGYGSSEAATAVAQAAEDGATDTDSLIRAALKLLAPKG